MNEDTQVTFQLSIACCQFTLDLVSDIVYFSEYLAGLSIKPDGQINVSVVFA